MLGSERQAGSVPNGRECSPDAVRVLPSINGDHTTWHGARVLAGTSTFAEHWRAEITGYVVPRRGYHRISARLTHDGGHS
jgi:hypothetical protein